MRPPPILKLFPWIHLARVLPLGRCSEQAASWPDPPQAVFPDVAREKKTGSCHAAPSLSLTCVS